MNYYIDGYNLLFHRKYQQHPSKLLEHKRQQVISKLSLAAQELPLALYLVFDGAHEIHPFTRQHFGAIEIIYTSAGLSADAFFIELLKEVRMPGDHTIISNDRVVQRSCRLLGAHIQSMDVFFSWLNQRLARLEAKESPPSSLPPLLYDPSLRYYQHIFEERLHDGEPSLSGPRLPPCSPPLDRQDRCYPSFSNDDLRWLHLFEGRLDPE